MFKSCVNKKNILVVLLLSFFLSTQTMAAPFCISIQGIAPQCEYFDAAQCQKRSYELSGICIANPDELILLSGNKAYCVVTSNRSTICAYTDRPSCEKEAYSAGGVCIDNTAPLGVQQDPYRSDRNKNY